MQVDLNRVMLIGRLKAEPVALEDGGVQLCLVTYTKNRQETTILACGDLGAKCLEHLTAGRLVYVEGELVDGNVHATDVHFLGKQRAAG